MTRVIISIFGTDYDIINESTEDVLISGKSDHPVQTAKGIASENGWMVVDIAIIRGYSA